MKRTKMSTSPRRSRPTLPLQKYVRTLVLSSYRIVRLKSMNLAFYKGIFIQLLAGARGKSGLPTASAL